MAADGLPIVALTADHDLSAVVSTDRSRDTLTTRYQLGDTGAALIRPDGYLAWHRPSETQNPLEALQSAVAVALSRPEAADLDRVA